MLQISSAQQNAGQITGLVSDSRSHELLPGVNVILRGTLRGTTTDVNGRFRLDKVPAGKWDIAFSLIGYTAQTIRQIEIKPDTETQIEVMLVQEALEAEQVVITAGRREQSLKEVPVSVSTITSKMISDHVSVTLDDALRYVPGVNMMMDQVNIRGSSGYSRGVGSRVLILIDGLPFITGDTGEINWETFPTFQVDRIEVVKGAGSALYGSSALGGVINIITKNIPETPEIQFRLFSGLYDKTRFPEWNWYKGSRFNTGGFISYSNRVGRLGYLINVSRTVDDSYRENDVYHRWGLYTKLGYNFSESQSIMLTTNVQWRKHGNFFWWKSLEEATRPAISQLSGEVNSTRGNVSIDYKNVISDKFFYSLKGIYYGNFWQDDSAGHVNNTATSHFAQFETQATYSISSSHLLTFGLAGNYDFVYSDIFGSHPSIGAALYLQYEYTPVQWLKITSGFRYDWQRIWREVFSSPTASSPSQLNPKLGLVLSPGPTTTIRASYGEGFRYPSISELFTSVTTGVSQVKIVPNDSLKPERSTSFEIGGSQFIGKQLLIDVALFQNDFYDLIEGGVDPNRFEIKFSNVTRARIRGFETGMKAGLFGRFLTTDLSYTYIDPEDLIHNTVLKFRPRHLFYASITASYRQLQLGLDYRYVSKVEAIDENLVRLAPIIDGEKRADCSVVDVRTSYNLIKLGLPLTVSLSIKNLTNYYYVELLGNLAPLRTYYFSLESSL